MQKVFVIANPHAGGGAARLHWPNVLEELKNQFGHFEFEESTAVGHAQYIAHDATKAGFDLVVAYGGDGTIHEVANGIWSAKKGTAQPTMGIICVGTGGDYIRTLGLPRNLSHQVKILAGNKTRRIDLGKIEFTNREGSKEKKVFINISSAGLSADVLRRLSRSRNLFGRKLAYLMSTLESYMHWKPKTIRIKTENPQESSPNFPKAPLIVVVGNGRYFGGGMPIAISADPSDGYFDLVAVAPIPLWKMPTALSLLYFKQFHRLEEVVHDRVKKVILESDEPVDLDIDGEPIGSLPATFEILPGAMEVKVPA